MKRNCRINKRRIFSCSILLSLLMIFAVSCLKDDTEELIAEHDSKFAAMKTKYGILESDLIGDGIYLHFTEELTGDTSDYVYAENQYYVVVDLEGYDSDGSLFDVTDYDVASANGVERADLVYGPIRVYINNTFPGFYKAIQKMPEGSKAVMLFPYDQAFGGYEPIAYKVSLYRVIEDYDTYLEDEFVQYRDSLGINPTNNLSIIGADSAYQIKRVPGTGDTPELEIGDSAQIFLHAHYVEVDDAYVEGFPGRCFFPISDSGDSIWFEVGSTYFPVTDIINSLVGSMTVGDSIDVITPALYTYGSEGFVHPYTGIYIVPPDISVHYTIKLLDYVKFSE